MCVCVCVRACVRACLCGVKLSLPIPIELSRCFGGVCDVTKSSGRNVGRCTAVSQRSVSPRILPRSLTTKEVRIGMEGLTALGCSISKMVR